MLAVHLDIRSAGLNDDGSVDTTLLLKPRVGVIPVGARLSDQEFVDPRATRCDGRRRQVRNAIHLIGHKESVPVDGGLLVHEGVVHRDTGRVPLGEEQGGPRNAAVDGERTDGLAGGSVPLGRDSKVVLHRGRAGRCRNRAALSPHLRL